MTADVQTILVAVIVIGALLYVLRRVLGHLRSFAGRTKSTESAACGSGCGKCGEGD